ncbi:MAG: hypothetical protein ACSLE6_17560 [Mycobacterium sp.]
MVQTAGDHTTSRARDAQLAEAAFGQDPGRWPLPNPDTSRGLWLRAVAAGGQGRYAMASADLRTLRRRASDRASEATGDGCQQLASLVHSTAGSFLRQLGWHDAARARDGQAWALAAPSLLAGHVDAEAGVDALVGLAADALGVGRFAASHALLCRAHLLLDRADPATVPDRLPLRLAWVSAELAMVSGDASGAMRHARHATELAGRTGVGTRHRVKTAMVLAAAHCSVCQVDAARSVADDALASAQQSRLAPLGWALAGLLADIGSETLSRDDLFAVRDAYAEVVRAAGGRWRNR